jgi:hypothetical protein
MNAWVKRCVLAVPLLAFLPAGCSVPPGPPVPDVGLARRVFVDVNAAPLDEVLRKIARSIECTLVMDRRDSRLQRRVTMTLINVSAETALRAVCETGGCRWQMPDHRTLKVDATEAPPVPRLFDRVSLALYRPLGGSWKFDRKPLGDILRQFSEYTPFDVRVEGADLSMPVTVDVTGEVPSKAIRDVLRAAGVQQTVEPLPFQNVEEKNDRITIRIPAAPRNER